MCINWRKAFFMTRFFGKSTVKILSLALALILLMGCDSGVSPSQTVSPVSSPADSPAATELVSSPDFGLNCAVLYSADHSNGSWQDVYSHLDQSLVLGVSVTAADVRDNPDFSGLDIIYLDESVISDQAAAQLSAELMQFVENGGALFLTNGFHEYFPSEFIGASEFVKLDGCPSQLQFPELSSDLGELQEIISDFASLYPSFPDYATISQHDYGYALKPDSATALVTMGDLALYSMNNYGDGYVFFTNPLLPNPFAITGFSLESRSSEQLTLSNTTASCNQLLENAFASFIFKQEFGFSLYRVFGSFGRPSMAWELHYEEITGFKNSSGIIFAQLCEEYSQIPSYTLIRNSMQWFMRAESVSYLLGEAGSGQTYSMDLYEGAYSTGAHVAAGSQWLSLAQFQNAPSYFVDGGYDQRAYPYIGDIDGDGNLDILCGSSDGRFYFFSGEGFTDGRLTTGSAVALTDSNGRAILVESYSAPVMTDANGDGILDIISGCSDGRVYWFSGNGDLSFEYEGLICNALMYGQSFPDVGDLDGDGFPDLVVGSDSGRLSVWYGSAPDALSIRDETSVTLPADVGTWLAPRVEDLDGDGENDLAIGTREGYIAQFITRDGALTWGEYLPSDEMNYKGNYNVKFSYNCVPFFTDINGDGQTDLIAGCLEYGLAYPIDSEYFPYYEELQETIDYIKDHEYYLGVHFYTTEYSSAEREAAELEYHISAMCDAYGIDLSRVGVNNHTWFSSNNSPRQSLDAIWDSGLLWNSGFAPANNSGSAPQINAQNVISLPFFMTRDGEKTLLIQNCGTLMYDEHDWANISAKYSMPMCLYYHCDFAYEGDAAQREYLDMAEDFRRENSYNFVTEDQLMLASAAAYNLDIGLEPLPDKTGFLISPAHESGDFALYDESYQSSCGIRISLGSGMKETQLFTDADVCHRDSNDIFISLNRPVTISTVEQPDSRICRVNIPAEISCSESGADIVFLDGGMMQVVVTGTAETDSDSWTSEEYDGKTVFTKYGSADAIHIKYI